jgi:hypothetical protein
MTLKNKEIYSGIIYAFFFVLQNVIGLVYSPYSFVSFYWITITIAIGLIGFNLPITKIKYRPALFFTITCVFGAFLSYINGKSFVGAITKSIFIISGFIGFVYLVEKRINLIVFDFLLVSLYIFFYFSYFSLDSETRFLMDGDFFGHSSSNAIAMSLNIILFFYLIISKQQVNQLKIFIFSIINLLLIFVQESRAGIVVSSLILVMSMVDLFNINHKRKYISYLYTTIIVFYFILSFNNEIGDYLSSVQLEGISTFQEDIRNESQQAFFIKMDIGSFLFGYPDDFNFSQGITRTFNSFLDFWNRFGFIPFFLFMVLLYYRISRPYNYSTSLIYFFPLIFYSLVEALWGGTQWDILIFLLLFYSSKK